MAEKKEFTIIENPDCVGKYREQGYDVVLTTIGRAWGDKDKGYQVCMPVPKTDEDAQKFYGTTIASLIEDGVKKLATQVDFTVVLVDGSKDFNPDLDDEAILNRLQEAADNFQVGQRAPGKAKVDKETLSQLDQLAIAMGFEATPAGRAQVIAALKAKHGN